MCHNLVCMLNAIMLSVIMLSVVMLSAVMLSVVMLNVVAPVKLLPKHDQMWKMASNLDLR